MVESEIVIRPASEVPRAAFVRALNAAYSDYYVPIFMTPRSFNEVARRESVRLECSAAAVRGKQIVGLGLLGVRGKRGWIGGMGVIPSFRGRGIGRRIMEYLLERARRLGLRDIQLEVITRNKPAFQLYRSLGFEVRRRLLVLSRESALLHPDSPASSEVLIRSRSPSLLIDDLARLPGVPRPWQREEAALRLVLKNLKGLEALHPEGGDRTGVCLYATSSYHLGLFDLAAESEEVGEALLATVLGKYPLARASYLNVAENDPMLPVLRAAGFRETLSQFEMHLSRVSDTQDDREI